MNGQIVWERAFRELPQPSEDVGDLNVIAPVLFDVFENLAEWPQPEKRLPRSTLRSARDRLADELGMRRILVPPRPGA